LARFDCIQSPYNLLTRDIEYELLPLCASEGVGVTVYNPLAAGMLTVSTIRQTADSGVALLEKGYHDRYWSDTNFKAISAVAQIAGSNSRSMAQFALAWILNNPTITSAICSATSENS